MIKPPFKLTPFKLAIGTALLFLMSTVAFSVANHYDGAGILYPITDIALIVLGVAALLSSLFLAYQFIKSVGYEDLKPLHWVPTELALLGAGVGALFLSNLLSYLFISIHRLGHEVVRLVFDVGFAVVTLYLIGYLYQLFKADRLQEKSWLMRNFKSVRKAYYNIHHKKRYGLYVVLYLAAQFVALWGASLFPPFGIFLWGVVTLAAIVIGSRIINQMSEIKQMGDTLARGEFDLDIKRDKLGGDFLDHAEKLGNLSKAINMAIDEKTASERMKTELVTNVSHDIKTPLTSIINYSDLLSKEELTGKSREYVDVLQRQSAKLKKLIDDLVEVSKASTGNIQVELGEIKITELYNQLAAEYADRFESAGLELMVKPKEATIYADSRQLWRVIDNLMQNILKYAMPHTRVFIDAELHDKTARLSFKNVSKEFLTIEPENLLQRFVRADESRSGEGSGLGLAIATSLMDIQDGSIKIETEGDLFKVYLELMRAE